MFKKAIAGVLSAVMCTATLLNDMPFSSKNTAEEGERIPAASQAAQSVTGLKGSNALARYLSKQGAEQAASQPAAQPLKASAAEAVYAVTNLDFDRETGLIQVTSTQSEAAKLLVSFIDEDSPANVYSVEFDAAAGEYVHSTFSADVSQLPASFTVTVILTGRAGLPLCKPFELRTYNRAVQEIKEKDTSDFEQAQIVNLDEDENTNFIVLSEDTVRAETTEESNVLVSADYDQNIYVFDHIDESIRSLEKGQYFYIQPTEDDIISTDIQEIVIDGDTATITGSGEIDDMFDFIKIEIDTAQTVVTDGMPDAAGEAEDTAAETAESSLSYLGVSAQVIDSEDEYNQRLDPSYDYSALLPPSNHIIKQDKPYDLGENISGIFSNDGTFTVIGYGDMNADASIPFTVRTNIRRIVFNDLDPDEGLYINNIANHLFSGSNNLEVVYMPERITSIGKAAFSGCENLKWLRYNGGSDTTKTFVLPQTLKTIGLEAFFGCTAAEFGDLKIPESVTTIGHSAFVGCEKIRTVTVPGKTETVLGRAVFRDCTRLKEAYLGPKVRCADDDDAFWFNNCAAIEKLTLPAFNVGKTTDNCTLDDLFNGSYMVPNSLTEVTVLSGTAIPEEYFYGLANLRSVTFSAELETVEINAFNCCSGLEEAYLIGEDSDWDKVVISETGNQPLLDIVRRGRPIVILSDLHDITVEEGQTAELAIYAAGKHELTYRWQYSSDGGSNWSTRAGDYGSKISFTANLDGYMYRCDVMDGYGNVVRSAEAKLTVTKKQTVPAGKQSPHVPGYKPGDANGDNSIDVSDAVLIARFAVGDTDAKIRDIGVINGDVNGDGNTDIQDVTTMLMFIARRIKVFPVEEM